MKELFQTIRKAFRLEGEILEILPLTDGGIHGTYQIRLDTGKIYIFQQINTGVFRNPDAVMRNIRKTASYLKEHAPEMRILHFYQTGQGEYLFQNWRVMDAIDGYSLKTCTNLHQIHQAGKAFGAFRKAVSGMDSAGLEQTISGFHDTRAYFQNLLNLKSSLPEMEILRSWQEQACFVCDCYRKGELPFQVTHGDMKCSNLLFDRQTNQPTAVIDWDTVMSGMPVYDFGDAVRSFASNVSSSEPDLSRVGISMPKFEAFATGWLSEHPDRNLLIPAVFSVTVELAVRYLTDYLQGNIYFRITHPEQNLIRARNQIRLAQEILKHQSEMEEFL
ncbi:MAG: aminoglycoside phosphotransferase family protein [Oscillospiraceae bacterium]|nr:aminoglycoside phosphotransferase family protein [Oscillospiraceae bacterium]